MNNFVKHTIVVLGSLIGTAVLTVGGYVGYVFVSYNRIGDKELTVDKGSSKNYASTEVTYKAISYNIGFGAYSQDYTFFMDTGYDANGNPTKGAYGKAKSKEEVEFNISGAISSTKALNPDFVFFQEVDTDSTRSFFMNQDKMIQGAFNDFDHVHCSNYHSAFFPYPVHDMIGCSNSGLTTLSKFKVSEAGRKELTVSSGIDKYLDLDRCFSYSKVNVTNSKPLYLVNVHMSTYDEGGKVRAKQMDELNAFLTERSKNGDHVVIGGDWDHDLLTYNPEFNYNANNKPFAKDYPGVKNKTPDWVAYLYSQTGMSPLNLGYRVVASDDYPSCRNDDIEYDPGKTFVCTIDGFVVSSNVNIISHSTIQTKNGNKGVDGFAFSDHEPVQLEFQLV